VPARARHGRQGAPAITQAFSVDSLAALREVMPDAAWNAGGVTLTGEVAPFTLMVWQAESG